MLYLLYGTDFKKTRKNLHTLTGALLKRKPDANVFTLNPENFSLGGLETYIEGQGLFSEKYIVVLDSCMEDKSAKETIIQKVKEIKESEHVFVIIEEKIDATTLKKLEKYSEKSQIYEEKQNKKKDTSFFVIADAFGSRDKKRLWVEYEKAIKKGASAEELHGIILWQIKSMIIARDSIDINDSGLKPFIYNKAKGFLRNFKGDDLDNIYKQLVEVYHEARRGNGVLEERIEEVILSID
ncbi:hypothetical protein COW81_02730 [Candidatus Campbellbacteria bacterium CG22_combo_CG10-13_8_21_14_all_36_13]|uniref:DNA polymerase III delta N-terminal domain-containing protein n=1 Tax=Candidatus Campbellbacteria bacterium CG22_combo_CG10-13_8_21_14_all_36_13 TaxID=1974529 RepID=A0A2H0DXS5_9BACT|nr:MAG: hypothetical protein COW81_02730 [Candidatus Campbellbacteria bacterium CG22_combo_CG10-13_8_21_14_all_36_13]